MRCEVDDGVGTDELLLTVRALQGLRDGNTLASGGAAFQPSSGSSVLSTKAAIAAACALQYKPISTGDLTILLALPLPVEAPATIRVGPFKADAAKLTSEEGFALAPAVSPESHSGRLPAGSADTVPGAVSALSGVLKRAPAASAGAGSSLAASPLVTGSSPCTRTIIRALEKKPVVVEVERRGTGGFLGINKSITVIARGAVSLECLLSSASASLTVPLYPPQLIPAPGVSTEGTSSFAVPATLIAGIGLGASEANGGGGSHSRRSSTASAAGTGSMPPGPCGVLTLSLRAYAPARDSAVKTMERRVPTVTSWPQLEQPKPAPLLSVVPAGAASAPTPFSTPASPAEAPGASTLAIDDDEAGPLFGADETSLYVSFDAMNDEVERVKTVLAVLRQGAPPSAPYFEPGTSPADAMSQLDARLGMLESMRFTLEQRVATEQLSLPDYLAQVRAAFKSDVALARELSTRGHKVAAAFAMGRAKVMAQEIKGTEEAMAQGELGSS